MWALGFEFSGVPLPTVLLLWVIKKESTAAWQWGVLCTYLTAEMVKIVSKKFFNLWKWSWGYAANEETFIQENLLKLSKKSEPVVFELRPAFPSTTTSIQFSKRETYCTLVQLRKQGSLSPQLPDGGLFSWEGQVMGHLSSCSSHLLLRLSSHQI